ncbi:MAG: formyltransferase family protein, partial [Alphaproteobacteria bacterium]|nr:formyltransferase family protein [Alphaproteobacteria bacterium]
MDLMASYDREFRAPDVAISRHVGVNACTVIELVKAEKPDLVLVSGTDLLRQELIDAIGKSAKIMNLHTGLSPYLKGGPNCTNWALALGKFDLIGNTVMWLDDGIDSGNLIATERTPLTGRESLFELHRKVMDHAHELYGRCYAQAVAGNKLPSVPQAKLASGRLFLSREWTGVQMLRALINFYLRYRPDPKLRPIELIGLETTPANEAKSARGGYRIAMLLPDLTLGGAERVALDLAREFVRLGHEVDFVLMRKFGQLRQALPEGVEVVDLQATKMRHIARPLAAYRKER